tara:strand:- start:361 stop:522 length:162 start_codon:yes stop_codon:yes gene_type:complete
MYEQLAALDVPGGILAAELVGADTPDGRLAGGAAWSETKLVCCVQLPRSQPPL